jgi:hypothetical protein
VAVLNQVSTLMGLAVVYFGGYALLMHIRQRTLEKLMQRTEGLGQSTESLEQRVEKLAQSTEKLTQSVQVTLALVALLVVAVAALGGGTLLLRS